MQLLCRKPFASDSVCLSKNLSAPKAVNSKQPNVEDHDLLFSSIQSQPIMAFVYCKLVNLDNLASRVDLTIDLEPS